jgi:hypothetical protein
VYGWPSLRLGDFIDKLKAFGEAVEKAPPGREDQVRDLKGKVDNPYAVAWASYNKKKESVEGGPGSGPRPHGGSQKKFPGLKKFIDKFKEQYFVSRGKEPSDEAVMRAAHRKFGSGAAKAVSKHLGLDTGGF